MTSASLGAPFQYSYHFFIFIFIFFSVILFLSHKSQEKSFSSFSSFSFLWLAQGFVFIVSNLPLFSVSLFQDRNFTAPRAQSRSVAVAETTCFGFGSCFFFSFFLLNFGALCNLVYVLSGCWEILGEEMNSLWRFCGWIGCCRILRIIIFFLIFFFFFGQFLGI